MAAFRRAKGDDGHMIIPPSKIRSSLDDLFNSAISGRITWEEAYENIGRLPGFEIVDRKKYRGMGCDWYVFGKEEWYEPLKSELLFSFTAKLYEVLPGLGYLEVDLPEHGDVVAYISGQESKHIGIYRGDVFSKFQDGPVYQHPLMAVPSYFGNSIVFFRKNRLLFLRNLFKKDGLLLL